MIRKHYAILVYILLILPLYGMSQISVARQWNEVILVGIRGDFARPTVHARNLMHTSMAMYDAWAAYDQTAEPYFLGNVTHGYVCPFAGISEPMDKKAAQEEAISYAAFRLIDHRFKNAPGYFVTLSKALDLLENELGFDAEFTSTDYSTGSPAALGNYIAEQIIAYGWHDGSHEANRYANFYYEPYNAPLNMMESGNLSIRDANRWQPLIIDNFIDQSGNPLGGGATPFLSPEWGNVAPFSLTEKDLTIYNRNGDVYKVYHDPGLPPMLGLGNEKDDEAYRWGFSMVGTWSSHLDPADGVMIDISPASIGNNPELPTVWETYDQFYDYLEGGDASQGHAINPKTGQPYAPQIVPRADYARVLAEFWADGPTSETPPGHWFAILNYVNDHPELVKKFRGENNALSDLEWDVKSYFILGGAMHDAAISAWGIKGWYDYVRPVSAIRYMAEQGQSSDPNLPNYSAQGLPLIDGYFELVKAGDDLAGVNNEYVGEIKMYAWRGPNFIINSDTSVAGVGWILAKDWWSYQRPSFVTPPFAGYISGHSTFSRAAAEVLEMLTGDEYFPGGMAEFFAQKNEFLVFEDGPSMDITLQWATYKDASDQTSLSRIWGGIHPPADDIPGRKIGKAIGKEAFLFAEQYFNGTITPTSAPSKMLIYPNPIGFSSDLLTIGVNKPASEITIQVLNTQGQILINKTAAFSTEMPFVNLDVTNLFNGLYFVRLIAADWEMTEKVVVARK